MGMTEFQCTSMSIFFFFVYNIKHIYIKHINFILKHIVFITSVFDILELTGNFAKIFSCLLQSQDLGHFTKSPNIVCNELDMMLLT